MDANDAFPETDWEIKRMLFQGQMRTVAICKKTFLFCNHIMKCLYTCRRDRQNERKHFCSFNKITNYYGAKYTATECELKFFNMIVRTNMSFSAAVSDELYCFAHFLIRAGQNSILEKMKWPHKIDVPSPHTIFPQISRQTISKNFSKAADSIRQRIFDNLKKFEYVCLAIDAGKINGNPILDITIVHVFSPSKPLLFKAFKEFNGTTEDYIEKVQFVIDELAEMKITVTSIVGDNVAAQKQAFNNSLNSMQQRYPNTIYSIPIWFSCLCHTISLVLDDIFESVDFLNELKTSTMLITKIFRSKPMVSTIGIICTSFCETRWTNQYDIFKWMIKHAKQIEQTFMNPPPLIHSHLKQI